MISSLSISCRTAAWSLSVSSMTYTPRLALIMSYGNPITGRTDVGEVWGRAHRKALTCAWVCRDPERERWRSSSVAYRTERPYGRRTAGNLPIRGGFKLSVTAGCGRDRSPEEPVRHRSSRAWDVHVVQRAVG